jgi:hypothetical protein
VRAARAVRAIGMTALSSSLARTEHGQTKQRLTMRARGYNKKKNALKMPFYRQAGESRYPAFSSK